MSANPPAPTPSPPPSHCRGCQKLLVAPADQSGLCEQCLLATEQTLETAPDVPPPEAAVHPPEPTATFDPLPETAGLRTSAPEPIFVSPREECLRERGWLEVRSLMSGGMGALYIGYDPVLQLTLVAKFILSHELRDGTRARFRVEAATLARLLDRNVARLFDYVEGNDPYMVMEYVAGGSLADRLRAAPPVTFREAAEWMEGAARGVAVAHHNGVIHRDLKPGNILLDRLGAKWVAKVTDFGMAKDVTAFESLTVGEAVIGTPEYMSPEQARRQSADCTARSDVWGLAATLYAAVTGQPPFTRDLVKPPVLYQSLTPPEALRPDLPAELAAIIRKGLEWCPQDRYDTAAAFADDLKRFLAGEPVLARRRAWPVRAWRRVQRMPVGRVAVAAIVLATATAVGAFIRPAPDPAPVATPVAPTPDQLIGEKMAALLDGKPITLMREADVPVWQKPLSGSPVLHFPPNADGDAAMTAFGYGTIALTPPLPVSRYTVEVELRDVAGVNVLGQNAGVAHHHFGLVIGLVEHEFTVTSAARKTPVIQHLLSGYEFIFCDYDRNYGLGRPTVNEVAQFNQVTYRTPPDAPAIVYEQGLRSFEFVPRRVAGKAGPWRKVVLAVKETGIALSWRDDTGRLVEKFVVPAVRLTGASQALRAQLGKRSTTPATVPQWPHPGGVGLTCYGATVAVRNLVIRPN